MARMSCLLSNNLVPLECATTCDLGVARLEVGMVPYLFTSWFGTSRPGLEW